MYIIFDVLAVDTEVSLIGYHFLLKTDLVKYITTMMFCKNTSNEL